MTQSIPPIQAARSVGAVILAAGKGTRLNASKDKNKVVYHLNNRPMVWYSLQNIRNAGINKIYVVVGFAKQSVMQALGDQVTYIEQTEQLGTGHALKTTLPHLDHRLETLISMYGDDSAFFPPKLITQLIKEHHRHSAVVTLLTLKVTDPSGLGRIIRHADKITDIVEEKNASPQERQIKEINTGLYCFNLAYLKSALPKIQKNPLTQEYYLTDIIGLANQDRMRVHSVTWPESKVWFGVNTPEQLRQARRLMAAQTPKQPA
jgi:bifunctional UDP-N-acetylglucosamine pyrophosphorylase/glucosamine-1-phosphate N-acetyltransferase